MIISIKDRFFATLPVIGFFAVILTATVFAANLGVNVEAENSIGSITSEDSNASEGDYVVFGNEIPPNPAPDPPPTTPAAGHNGQVGCRITNCPTEGPQNLSGQSGRTIENIIVTNPNGQCANLSNASNITFRNVTFKNCANSTPLSGSYTNPIIPADGARNITFENVLFEEIARRDSADKRNNLFDLSNVDGFVFKNSEVKNLRSDISVGGGQDNFGNRVFLLTNGSRNVQITRSHFINPGRNVFQTVLNGAQPGIEISYNRIEGRGPNDSDFEDMVNFYASGGTTESPVLLKGNYFRFGGPSRSGTAAILGDSGRGRPLGNNIHAIENVAINTGHAGFGLYGGENNRLIDNIVYADIEPPDTNAVGIFVFREDSQYGADSCRNNVVTGNRVWFKNSSKGGSNDAYIEQGRLGINVACENTILENNVFGDTTLQNQDLWPFD